MIECTTTRMNGHVPPVAETLIPSTHGSMTNNATQIDHLKIPYFVSCKTSSKTLPPTHALTSPIGKSPRLVAATAELRRKGAH